MGLLIAILILVIVAGWAVLSSRLREVEKCLAEEIAKSSAHESVIRDLIRRLSALEGLGTAPRPAVSEEKLRPAQEPVLAPAEPPVSIRLCQFCGRSLPSGATICVCGAAASGERAPSTPPPLPEQPFEPLPILAVTEAPAAVTVPQPSWRDRLREKIGDQEWEAMVGGSWLNKLGVLLLVIGIALLLGYEFARVGPAGRIATGLGVSLTMLIGGVLIERRPLYRIFGRGLIGGGWAALYFTTYAMHAVAAAKILDNAYLATTLLLIVASGMILHSLRYRSQAVSGLAYFIAFATLALSESTPFSVLALIPLAASLLVLAYRFDWYKMAVFGLFATYATCASRPDAGAPLGTTQALFASYWLLFEIFDILRLRRRVRGFTAESLILPLNALGFLALSVVKWLRMMPAYLYLFLAASAGLYLASAIIRVLLRRPSEGESTVEHIAAGEYEGPVTIFAALAAASIFRKAPGVWIDAGLLIEGEALFLAGVRFGQTYLRQLASAVFTLMLVRLLGVDVPAGGQTTAFGKRAWMSWSPPAVAAAAVFYLNRAMRAAGGGVYSSVAAVLISLVLAFETPHQYVCVAWLVFAALLFELGFRTRKAEFLFQSYILGALGTGAGLLMNIILDDPSWRHAWLPIAIAAMVHYAITLRIRFREQDRDRFSEAVGGLTSASATAFLMALFWKLAPGDYLGLAWLILGVVLFELGIRKLPDQFRSLSYAVSTIAFLRLFYFNILLAHRGGPPAQAVSLGLAALACYAMSARVFQPAPDRIPSTEREWYRDLNCAAATSFLLALAWIELPAAEVALAWALVGLVILETGFGSALSRFRFIGNLAVHAAFGRLFFANFTNLGNTLHVSHRMLTVLPIAISEYYVWRRYRLAEVSSRERSLARLYLYAPAILIFVLVRFELGRSLAVVGWALFSVVLFRIGLTSKIADLRWQSYGIALLAFWRCWNTNFYIPESLAGIRGRVLTGGLVVASFYAAQLFAPRSPAEDARGLVDRYARTFYSLLASVLLAVLLFYEVSGGVLTMAWGAEALALLGGGFPLRDRLQRLSGLFLFMVCVLKLFLYDLRQLETINRILSFIVLGVILVSVSWIYTRFRDRIQRYL